MLKFLNSNQRNFIQKLSIILDKRRKVDDIKFKLVRQIIKDIKKNKDLSLIKYEKKYSKQKKIHSNDLIFSKQEINQTIKKLNNKTKKSIDLAYDRILKFHKNQKFVPYKYLDKYKNFFSYISTPIEKVGVYVPGGTASYPSSVLMNCIPAITAGVKKIYMTTPCINKNCNPAILYAAKKCNVKEIYKVGGAQAIAAFAYGTKKINKVDKIVGPGNEFVALAKKEVFGDVGIDMVAGPSEVTVVADKHSNPEWVAADLIAQAEHDNNAQSILLSNNLETINKVNFYLKKLLKNLPKRKIASQSIRNFGISILVKKEKLLIDIINEIAPEHLELYIKKSEKILKKIKNAGSIFLGKYSPEAVGDYLAGPNHVLPTAGSAKFSSGLSVYDFLKRHSIIKMSKSGIESLGASVINLAKFENLEGHANSVKIRIKKD
ncbi:histidinol dehydrogenase [Pelagibacteraceae bacterium]|jgi:histidinol dehydrogenase|nr:histidinol dehydrogenase [Pelagibacteraceae bacterium]|tara:strand:- start:134 stop:1432 length:1299 start_codon:yes stop_codon:yes gene_type:complete